MKSSCIGRTGMSCRLHPTSQYPHILTSLFISLLPCLAYSEMLGTLFLLEGQTNTDRRADRRLDDFLLRGRQHFDGTRKWMVV